MENDSELVLERITEDGTFDELRKEIVERVKQDEALNAFIEEAVLNSKALASTKADSKGRQGDVYNSIRKELESKALDRALQATWKVFQDKDTGLSATIEQRVSLQTPLVEFDWVMSMYSLEYHDAWCSKVHEALCGIYEQRAK